jgi:hypothetical protein
VIDKLQIGIEVIPFPSRTFLSRTTTDPGSKKGQPINRLNKYNKKGGKRHADIKQDKTRPNFLLPYLSPSFIVFVTERSGLGGVCFMMPD